MIRATAERLRARALGAARGACAVALIAPAWLLAAGADSAGAAPPQREAAPEVSAEELELGRITFHRRCVKCHGSGREDAPVVSRPGEWAQRLRQPVEVLVQHAIEGHRGARGEMPPKGGFSALSDAEVSAAVHYIVARGEWLASRIESNRIECVDAVDSTRCEPGDSALLRLLWILTGIRERR